MHANSVAGLFAAILCTSFSGLPAQSSLPAESVQRLLRRVDDHYNHLTSMRTHYTEHYQGLGMDRSESGTLLLKKPGRMLWRYDQPAGKVFVLDGRFAYSYTPGEAQAQRVPASRIDDLRTPLRFLLGHTSLEKELSGITVTLDGPSLKIVGAPKGTQHIRQIALEVTPQGEITAMSLTDPDGSTTSFQFTGTEENVPVKPGDFRFVPPAGVTIVDGALPL